MPPRNPMRAGPARHRGEDADEVRPFVLLEHQRRDVGQLADAVDDGELNVGIVLRDRVENRRLREADADDEVVFALGKRAHGRLDVDRRARLDVAQHDPEAGLSAVRAVRQRAGLGAFHAVPRGGIEGAIVLAADVEHDAGFGFRGIADRVGLRAARGEQREAGQREGRPEGRHYDRPTIVRIAVLLLS